MDQDPSGATGRRGGDLARGPWRADRGGQGDDGVVAVGHASTQPGGAAGGGGFGGAGAGPAAAEPAGGLQAHQRPAGPGGASSCQRAGDRQGLTPGGQGVPPVAAGRGPGG